MTAPLHPFPAKLSEDFACATFGEGGLLLHLPSGNYFQLDATGAAVWAALLSCPSADGAAAVIAGALHLQAERAATLVRGALESAAAMDPRPPAGIARFEEDETSLSLRRDEVLALSFDKRSSVLSSSASLRGASDETIGEALRIFVPKMFGRWCRLALHASAVQLGERSVLFAGDSGAGKTTTVRALARQARGGRVLCEDVAVLTGGSDTLAIVDGAEGAIQRWMNDAAEALVALRRPGVEVEPLRGALFELQGRSPVHKLILLEPTRRHGRTWSLRSLSRVEVLAGLFRHSFIYSADSGALRSHLDECHSVAGHLRGAEAVDIPDGLDALEAIPAGQIETIAS